MTIRVGASSIVVEPKACSIVTGKPLATSAVAAVDTAGSVAGGATEVAVTPSPPQPATSATEASRAAPSRPRAMAGL
ncbi:MAG: hypothetical protein QM733_05560 [Ilumatobacteraceae bacterium]